LKCFETDASSRTPGPPSDRSGLSNMAYAPLDFINGGGWDGERAMPLRAPTAQRRNEAGETESNVSRRAALSGPPDMRRYFGASTR